MDIPGYQIDQIMHEGGRSIVYRGRSAAGDPVIIKTPSSEYPGLRQIARFQHAFDLGLGADPEIVVRHIDLIRYQSSVALITEDYDGVPLNTVIPESGFRLEPLINISLALATALARLHASGYLHKDIKPDNILVNLRTYELRFIDLGLATRFNREDGETRAPDTIEGTLQYAAPEQLGRIDSPLDDRADLYSLGATLFHIATGTLPFCQTEPTALVHAHVALPPPVLSDVRNDLPAVFSNIVARLLGKNVEDRYASAAGLAHDLEECASRFNQTGAIRDFTIAANDISPRFRIPDKLYGRQAQCTQLFEAFEKTRDGARTLVTVSGHSGVGKTAFVNHMQRPIVAHSGMFCSGKFDQFHQDRPYLGILKAFREILRKVLAEPDAVLKQFQTRLQEAVGIHGELLTDGLPELKAIIGEQPAVDEIAPLDAERRFNGLVSRFLQVFATPQSPLVVFIDDLQWADPASIHLLEAISFFQQLDHLMLIVGYRSNELGIGHPARKALDALSASAANHVVIELGSLSQGDITEMLADTLHVSTDDVDLLGKHVHGFATGNVFFARELLLALRKREFFRFDEKSQKWKWDIRSLTSHAMPDNVAELLTQRLSVIPDTCMALLDTASCIGSEFDLRTLASVHEIAQSDAAAMLTSAVQNNLVLPLDTNHNMFESLASWSIEDDEEKDIGTARYRFQHDQVRLTVHNRQDDAQRNQSHLRIGRLLLRKLSNEELATRGVEIFEHLSYGVDLVTDANERLAFAELGLKAGRSAQRGLAYASARTMLMSAASLLPDTAWDENYKLALDINLSLADCAHALENSDEFEFSIKLILQHAKTPIDAAPAQGLLIRVRNTQGRHSEAVDIAVDAAHSLGISLPRRPSLAHVLFAVSRALLTQGRKNPLDYENLRETTDPRLPVVINLLSQAANAAYFSEPNLVPLIAATCTRLSIRHGVSPSSTYGMAVWGLVLCGVLGRIDNGYQFGKLALRIGRRYGGVEEARARFIVGCMVNHWKEPLVDTAILLYKDWGFNRDAGDEESAVYCAGVALYTHFFSGESADPDLRFEGTVDYINFCNKPHVKDCLLAWIQLFETLRIDELPEELCGSRFNLTEKLPEFEQTRNGVQIAISLIAAGILDHFAGRYERAEERFATAMKWEDNIVSQVLVPGLAFFRALNAYRLFSQQPANRKLLRMARRQTRRIRKWAKFAPFNMDHRVALLAAEEHLVKGKTADAVMSLHKAINQAANGAILYQALAERRLSEVHAAAGNAIQAQQAEDRARTLFEKWGANALANTSGLKPKKATTSSTTHRSSDTTLPTNIEGMDLQSLLEAIRAISSSIDRKSLLDQLMVTVMQAAGSDRGILVLVDSEGYPVVEAVSDADMNTGHSGIRLSEFKEMARPMVDLALRTGETVVIDDAGANDIVADDPHTVDTHVRSIMAANVLLKNRSLGIFYLENHVARGAFTAGRIKITEALAAQAGIALENARLYQKTQDDLAIQTALTAASRRFVPQGFLSGLGRSSVVDVQLNEASEQMMNVLFADLRSFTELSKQMGPLRTVKMINRYLSHVQPGIAAYRGFVGQYYGDGVLALFPGEASDSIHGAIAMCRGLDAYNREREDFPELRFGIGIHSGSVTLGTIGDPDHFQCSVVGDSVNLASRMEALTKFYFATLLVSGATYTRMGTSGIFAHRYLGPVQVPGRSEVIAVYECLDAYSENKREKLVSVQDIFGTAVAAYIKGQWAEAGAIFDECIRQCPDDKVSLAFSARCLKRNQHPIDWKGIERPEKSST